MAMKTKLLSFVPKTNIFVGADYDNKGKLGIVTFSDHCEMTKKARELAEEILEEDEVYRLLVDWDENEMASEIWSIFFHKFLIDELEENGWTITMARSEDFKGLDLTKNHMQI
jgi:nitrogenase subunit NifH